MGRIILIDDEKLILKSLERLLLREGHEVETYEDSELALKRLQSATFDIAISDYRMPGMSGVELLKQARQLQPDMLRIILSAYGDLDAIKSAINEAEIYRFISKPWDDFELLATVEKALEFHQVLFENRMLAEQVKRQEEQLDQQDAALKKLEREHPEIARVEWGSDGSIVLNDEDI